MISTGRPRFGQRLRRLGALLVAQRFTLGQRRGDEAPALIALSAKLTSSGMFCGYAVITCGSGDEVVWRGEC